MSSLETCLQPRFQRSAQLVLPVVLGGLAAQERKYIFEIRLLLYLLTPTCYSYFVGCCTTNPCQTTCPQGNLYPASFDVAYYGKFDDATCGIGSDFFTCIFPSSTFMGCCKTNACAGGGCLGSNLTGALLGTEDLRNKYGAIGASSTSSSLSSTTKPSSTLSTTTTGTLATATSAAAATPVPKKEPIAAIAGGAAGGAFALAVVVGLLIYYFCHAKKSRKGHDDSVTEQQSGLPDMVAVQDGLKGFKPRDGK